MKKLILATSLIASFSASASTFVCTDLQNPHKTVAVISLQENGKATVKFNGFKTANGTFEQHLGQCPSRNCGNIDIEVMAVIPAHLPYDDLAKISVSMIFQSIHEYSQVTWYPGFGNEPEVIQVNCSL